MAYTRTTWANGSGGATPISAANLNNIEDGIREGAPAGGIMMFGGSAAPTGWLLCDGTSYLRATYSALFTAISTSYGSVDGTHFNVPDFRGRVAVGLGTNADVDALGDNDGAALADRRPKHKHAVTAAALGHTHSINDIANIPNSGGPTNSGGYVGVTNTESGGTAAVVGPQTNVPTDGPANLVVNYIIKT